MHDPHLAYSVTDGERVELPDYEIVAYERHGRWYEGRDPADYDGAAERLYCDVCHLPGYRYGWKEAYCWKHMPGNREAELEEAPDPLPEPGPRSFMTPPEAAEILDVHDETVRRWIDDGTLHAQKYHGVWAIKKADVWRLRGVRIGNTLRGPGMRAVEADKWSER